MTYPPSIYPELLLDMHPLKVEPLQQEQARELAPEILRLIVASYGTRFEGPDKPLPEGLFARKYNTKEAIKRFRETVIPGVFSRGGAYSAIREPADNTRLVSVLKTLPGGELEKRFTGMVGIAEILTDPRRQLRGYGAALLHAYLRQQESQEARVLLDAFERNPVNAWYRRLGFQPEEPSGSLELDDHHALPTRYYVIPEDIVVAGIVQRLQTSHPALGSSKTLT